MSIHLFLIAALLAFVSCNDADFSGSDSSPDADSAGSTSEIDEVPTVADDCEIDGDVVVIDAKAQTIKDCIAAEKIYHFDWEKCTDVPKASSYDCTFEGVKAALTALSFSTESIDAAIDNNAKLIACGEKSDGNTIVVQWWSPAEDQCIFDGTDTTTACYKHYSSEEEPPDPTSKEEVRAAVKACIEE